MKLFNYFSTRTKPPVLSTCSDSLALLLLSLTLTFLLSLSEAQAFDCPGGKGEIKASECEALKQIYNATGGPNWRHNGDPVWPDGVDCGSHGVSCVWEYGVDTDRHVSGLFLSGVEMTGVLPDVFSDLPFLGRIIMSSNSLTGSIPGSIAGLESLGEIALNDNNLTGIIPEGLLGHEIDIDGYRIWLRDNNLTGELPINLGSAYITHLHVRGNPGLKGRIPDSYIQLNEFYSLGYSGTQICEPQYQEMQDWLNGLTYHDSSDIPCDDLKPGTLIASDGTSTNHVNVEWGESVDADFYILERAKGETGPFTWLELRTLSTAQYLDRSAQPGIPYQYRVKGCSDANTCSSYSNIDLGFRDLQSPTTIYCIPWESDLGYSWEWDSLEEDINGIIIYDYYEAIDLSNYTRYEGNEDNFELLATFEDVEDSTFRVKCSDCSPDERQFSKAVTRCTYFTCSIATMWNDGPPPIGPAVNLLLNNNELE